MMSRRNARLSNRRIDTKPTCRKNPQITSNSSQAVRNLTTRIYQVMTSSSSRETSKSFRIEAAQILTSTAFCTTYRNPWIAMNDVLGRWITIPKKMTSPRQKQVCWCDLVRNEPTTWKRFSWIKKNNREGKDWTYKNRMSFAWFLAWGEIIRHLNHRTLPWGTSGCLHSEWGCGCVGIPWCVCLTEDEHQRMLACETTIHARPSMVEWQLSGSDSPWKAGGRREQFHLE